MKKSLQKIYFKEDDKYDSFIQQDKDVIDPMLKVKKDYKEDLLDHKELINTKRPKDPFKDLDPLS